MSYVVIDAHSAVPIYEQIMDQIRGLIRDGVLAALTPLPPVRQLAADLEVNANTVARAYGLLEREGILVTAGRRGTLVAESARESAVRSAEVRAERVADRVIEEIAALGVSLAEFERVLQRRWAAHEERMSV